MGVSVALDREAIAQVCVAHGVRRLRVFGSALAATFDPSTSDVDFLVDFLPGTLDLFDAYFGLREDLAALLGRDVDLVMAGAIRNPHFAATALGHAQDLYAA